MTPMTPPVDPTDPTPPPEDPALPVDPPCEGTDADGDGHVSKTCCNGAACGDDCDDDEDAAYPGNPELCDGIDNDCDGTPDDVPLCMDCNPACGSHSHCEHPGGAPTCVCDGGYQGDGQSCTDVDECASNNGGCDTSPDACVNAPGSFMCMCPSGYVGNGVGSGGCTDVDECASNNGGCDSSPDACVNAPGSFMCMCPSGYTGNGVGSTGCIADSSPSPTLPTAQQACPTIVEGTVRFLGRDVRVWVGNDGLSLLGPLVFYWHGTGSNPTEAEYGLGTAAIDAIKAMGGMVAAMSAVGGSGTTTGNNVWYREDFVVIDEVVACAVAQVGIDPRRIHALGMSAGGLQTTAMSFARSSYLASVVTYSGGLITLTNLAVQDPSNKLPAMIVHGAEGADVVVIDFAVTSRNYETTLESRGHFAFRCDHGGGHTIPSGIGASAWRFFYDHPYRLTPEPYAGGLPGGGAFPSYCAL